MDEEEAREMAFAILMEFEEVLDEFDVTIPSADREGREEEARLYGTEYYVLEDAITEILRKVGSGPIGLQEARRLSFLILEEIEETLRDAGVGLPPGLVVGSYGYPRIGEREWDRLREAIVRRLGRRMPTSGTRSKRSFGPSDEAGAACEQMRRRMVEAAEVTKKPHGGQ
jgi:hypothetical protein